MCRKVCKMYENALLVCGENGKVKTENGKLRACRFKTAKLD